MLDDAAYEREQRSWLANRWGRVPSAVLELRPSEWAEKHRYLPPSVTPLPGIYSFDLVPYLREIIDCLSLDSPIREVSVMKGSQLGVTVGVLENFLGYLIGHVRTAPVMLVTADDEMAKNRMESYVTPMLQHSGLVPLIKSIDETNTRKTGKRDGKLEWEGGGFLIAQGAQNKNKLRSQSIRFLLNDEIDGWPETVGKDGDPMELARARTSFYEDSRKILDISTPTIKGRSKIETRFEQGDQRHYWVCCLKCAYPQVLRFKPTKNETGERYGLVWETENGRLVAESVRYICKNPDCNHGHINEDKVRLLSPEHGAEWRPSAQATTASHRSYHLSALYAPAGTRSWSAIVEKWLEAWDEENERAKDLGLLQVFYNNELGSSFTIRGDRVKFETVSGHRRHEYQFGQVPNRWAAEFCGGPVFAFTCTVDVHKDNLAVAVIGWCRDRRAVLVEYLRLEGDTEQLDDPGTWGALRKLIEEREWKADDGKTYRVTITLIDSGYRTDTVFQFARDYATVFPIKGREQPPKNATIREFSEFNTPGYGVKAFGITVDLYKDRWHAALRRGWDGLGIQPAGHFNAPQNTTDAQLKELTVEVKREKLDSTGRRIGIEWFRPSGAANELWDLLIYGSAAFDILAWSICQAMKLEHMNWPAFYDACEGERLFFTE